LSTRQPHPSSAVKQIISKRSSTPLAEILLFDLLDRPRIMRAAHKAAAPFIIIRQWAEEGM